MNDAQLKAKLKSGQPGKLTVDRGSSIIHLFASQFLCAHLPVLKFGGKKAHRPYSLCSTSSIKNMKKPFFIGHKEVNLRTKQCGENVFQLDLNVLKHD
jgi:hypothetical protein